MVFDETAASSRRAHRFIQFFLGAVLVIGSATLVAAQISPVMNSDPPRTLHFKKAGIIANILRQPVEALELARIKLIIDKMIEPAIDIEANLRTLDTMVTRIKSMPEFGVSSESKLRALTRYVYEPGTWNDYRPFQYDLDDPFGSKISNKLLPSYFASRKGNCVTMPFLFIILGQRLGIDVTAATAPKHFLVKFRNDAGIWINLEATSGASPARDVWIRSQLPMSDQAIANGVYLQPLTKKETAAVIVTTLAEYYLQQQQFEKAIAIADLILEYYPKNVGTMTLKAVSYGRLARKHFMKKYPSPNQIPENEKRNYEYLAVNNRIWFSNAEALGWREPTEADEKKYQQTINQVRQQKDAR